MYRYTLKYRPPDFCTTPRDREWKLVESGTGGYFPLRYDLPTGKFTFGVIAYETPLTPDEITKWEMIDLNNKGNA